MIYILVLIHDFIYLHDDHTIAINFYLRETLQNCRFYTVR